MKKPLLDVVFASEKRKDTLLILQAGPKEMVTLLQSLKTTRQSLLPQIRILEEHHLVTSSNDIYELTTIGKLVVDEMIPFLDTIEVFDYDIEYWGTHNLDFIPPYLLERVHDFCSCKVITPSILELYDVNKEFFEYSNKSKSLTLVVTFLYPNFPVIYGEWIKNVEHITFIASKELYEKIKSNYSNEFQKYIDTGKFDFFVYTNAMNFVSFAHNDYCTFFRLLLKTGEYDNKQLICCNPRAVEWNIELSEYYLKESIQITEI
ncbi:MAG: winged helix-turn-helix domain-containing protein [Methanolobus sp.]|nr:winged helix-turn-helix domain-containing protein [Methanolobus sp.]